MIFRAVEASEIFLKRRVLAHAQQQQVGHAQVGGRGQRRRWTAEPQVAAGGERDPTERAAGLTRRAVVQQHATPGGTQVDDIHHDDAEEEQATQ